MEQDPQSRSSGNQRRLLRIGRAFARRHEDSLSYHEAVSSSFSLEILAQSSTVAEMARLIVAHRQKTRDGKELDDIFTELDALSDDEAEAALRRPGESAT